MDTPIYNKLMNASNKNWTAPTASDLELWTAPIRTESVIDKVVDFAKRTIKSLRELFAK